ncbi:50S ribosomal protein L32 [Entomospira nematocerorum]|uniref:Large ribosomal subunit protein bL32 n=2 Tax=Entomospira TaxID=2834378 RepID=A0A968GF47_9SPIO|nr:MULTISPECIES: 50S ribosomal protein L32 [Entomospira]NIZ40428.1 50S ribosomal protein L32 [Entomospira entomophilus]NIZ47068.1 50S ribosomal protein L32 [Entomospira nematocera]WDI34387.1 50S ribosomal protein L32 [Entomospira nematocera]WDI35986.1 50S ribosomal protein L32 [Entomospira entomophilus]
MAVPKYKPSKARTHRRRTINMRLASPALSTCSNCGNVVTRHRACQKCGFYRGHQILDI